MTSSRARAACNSPRTTSAAITASTCSRTAGRRGGGRTRALWRLYLDIRGQFDIAARIARVQHGRVARRQLLAAGIDRSRIDRWLADGRLRPVHRGVYAVGHDAPSLHADYMAAVLLAGDGAVLSHRAAAFLLGLARGPIPRPEVTVATGAGRKHAAIVQHRVTRLDPLDVTIHARIPITIVARVLLDIAPRTPPADLARACHEAWVRHRTNALQIEACVGRNPRKHGIRKLRTAMGADVTLSHLERGFVALLRRHGLAVPRTNIDRHGDKVDCHWPQFGLTIELVSFRYHATRQAFETDVARRRRSAHVAYTYGDVFERAAATLADLRPRLQTPAALAP